MPVIASFREDLDQADLNLRNLFEVSVLTEEGQAMADGCRSDPGVHHSRPSSSLPGLSHDCCEYSSNLSVNRNPLKVTLNSANCTKSERSRRGILRKENTEVQFREGND